jgi:hypothetical protein
MSSPTTESLVLVNHEGDVASRARSASSAPLGRDLSRELECRAHCVAPGTQSPCDLVLDD